jgi:hypothetical protein
MSARATDPLVALGEQWLEPWRQASLLARDGMTASLAWDFQRQRSRWFGDLTRAMDAYMRSPAFLELVRFNLGWMTRPGR